MPSKPKSKTNPSLVLVQHAAGARKHVHRTRLRSLSKRWTRVSERPARKPADPNPETPTTSATSKED